MKHKNNGKRYNEDFRKMVYGVSEVTIYAWIKKFSPIELEDGSSVTPDDYAKLQKQILRLQEENEILKKAMAIFAKK